MNDLSQEHLGNREPEHEGERAHQEHGDDRREPRSMNPMIFICRRVLLPVAAQGALHVVEELLRVQVPHQELACLGSIVSNSEARSFGAATNFMPRCFRVSMALALSSLLDAVSLPRCFFAFVIRMVFRSSGRES